MEHSICRQLYENYEIQNQQLKIENEKLKKQNQKLLKNRIEIIRQRNLMSRKNQLFLNNLKMRRTEYMKAHIQYKLYCLKTNYLFKIQSYHFRKNLFLQIKEKINQNNSGKIQNTEFAEIDEINEFTFISSS